MSREKQERNLTRSILNRLLPDEPKPIREIRKIREFVRRDLEALLNTRLDNAQEIPDEFEESRKSLLTYGLPDLTTFQLKSDQERRRLIKIIENVIRTFEPRLQNIRVTLKSMEEYDSALHFKIEGILKTEPATERVVFDTALELISREIKVQGLE